MELTLSGAVVAEPVAPGPGPAEPTDAAATAFAALLGALLSAAAAAPPSPPAPGVPEETVDAGLAGGGVLAARTGERAPYPALGPIATVPIAGPSASAAPVQVEELLPDPAPLDGLDPEVPHVAAPGPVPLPDERAATAAPGALAGPARPAAPAAPAGPAAPPPPAAPSGDRAAQEPTLPIRVGDAMPLPPAAVAATTSGPVDVPVEAAPQQVAATSAVPIRPATVPGAPAPAPPATPVEQVVRVVTPLRRLADGQHDLVLELRPADLGAVRVELSLDKGVVHLGLRAELEQTNQLLRAALPELRQQLDAAGVMAGRVTVDTGETGGGGRHWRTAPDDADPGRRREVLPDDDDAGPTASSSTSVSGHVDVLL